MTNNALAKTINGLYKAELIHRRAPWKTKAAVELATLEWVAWFNHHSCWNPSAISPRRRLRQTTIGNSPRRTPLWRNLNQTASSKPGAIQRETDSTATGSERMTQNKARNLS